MEFHFRMHNSCFVPHCEDDYEEQMPNNFFSTGKTTNKTVQVRKLKFFDEIIL